MGDHVFAREYNGTHVHVYEHKGTPWNNMDLSRIVLLGSIRRLPEGHILFFNLRENLCFKMSLQ